MFVRAVVCALVVWTASARPGIAQSLSDPAASDVAASPSVSTASASSTPRFWAPFLSLPRDLGRVGSRDGITVLGIGVAGALTAHRWDTAGIQTAQSGMRPALFEPGNVGGTMLLQTGASIGLYTLASAAGSDHLTALGADLVRAQVLAQTMVQAGKWTTRRARPDRSNNLSLPSGHAAGAFATAAVVQRRYGWRAGVPAYAFGAYVAAARMAANRHHLSDVLMGAAVGIAAGRTVTVGRGRSPFAVGLSPLPAGAAITVSR